MNKKPRSRLQRTMRSLLFMIGIGAILAILNGYNQNRDVSLATGPAGDSQRAFFATAADRPDIALFFKGLTPSHKLIMAERIGEYNDPKLGVLVGKLLGTFDSKARAELTKSLVRIGKTRPEAVASQLSVAGSLQQLAVSTALREVGPSALTSVASKLKVADARANAAAYLVSFGAASIPYLLPGLAEEDKDVRLAAADALGKLGSRESVQKLVELYRSSEGDEKFGYLSALSGIGDPATETLLSAEATNQSVAGPRRAQAMLGLGRISTDTTVSTLWALFQTDDPQIKDSAISALQLAGNRAFLSAPTIEYGLLVAGGVPTPESDKYIYNQLGKPNLRLSAAKAAENRPSLVGFIVPAVSSAKTGKEIDALMRALSTTAEGLTALQRFTSDPAVGGFAFRRLRMAGM